MVGVGEKMSLCFKLFGKGTALELSFLVFW